MSLSEIAFLALGLVLGAVLGAALSRVGQDRFAPRREVRLTIMPNAIPARRRQAPPMAPDAQHSERMPVPATPAVAPAAGIVPVPASAPARDTGRPGGAEPASARTRVPSGDVVLPDTVVGLPVGMPADVSPAATTPAATSAATSATTRETPPAVAPPRPPSNGGPEARASAMPAVAIAAAATGVALLEAPERPRPALGPAPALLPSPTGAALLAVRPLILPDAYQRRDGAGRGADRGANGGATSFPPEAFTTLVRPRPPVEAPRPRLAAGAVATVARPAASVVAGPALVARPALAPPSGPTLTRPRGSSRPPGPEGAAAAASAAWAPGAVADPCSGQRRAVDERCALADVARDQARRAGDALREAQRAYDILRDRVDRAEVQADPRRVAAVKERLHSAFRTASDRAGRAEETEAAARAWLNEINALNNAVREAQRTVESGTAELRSRIGALERLSAEADAARIAGENAEAGCREAREDLAGCEEADADARTRAAVPPEPVEPHPFAEAWPSDNPDLPDDSPPTQSALLAGLPLIVRVLRGDREARERLVATLAAGDAEAARDWGLRVSRLADKIIGRAIEDGYLDLPEEDPFWRLFSQLERRDIVSALSALGFRFDGLGGFADGRAPAARDLSLAVGYAGLDRMRIRTWPRDSEIALMYEQAVVAADEWLADQAGDLSLGRMVDALGNRSAELADVWNAWGRVRPALLSV